MRILFGPIRRSHPEAQDILRTLTEHEIVTYNHEDADIVYDFARDTFADVLGRMPAGWRPDVVFFLSPEYNGVLPGIEGCPYPLACTVGDWNLGFHAIREVCGAFELIFTDRAGVEVFERAGYENVEHAKLFGFVPDQHYRAESNDQPIDISLVGNLNHEVQRERSRWLARIADLSDKYNVKILAGLYGDDYRRAVQQSKITFNRSIRGEMNMRAYEAPACGSLMFYEEENLEVRDVYDDRVHCVLYNTRNLEELIEYYLLHESERRRIIEQAHARVQEFSIGLQWRRIVDHVLELGLPGRRIRRFTQLTSSARSHALARQALQCITPGGVQAAVQSLSSLIQAEPAYSDYQHDLGVATAQLGMMAGDPTESERAAVSALNSFGEAAVPRIHAVAKANRAMLLASAGHNEAEANLQQAVDAIRSASSESLISPLYFPRSYDSFKVEHERICSSYGDDPNLCGEALRGLYLWRLFEQLGQLQLKRGAVAEAVTASGSALDERECGDTRYQRALSLEAIGGTTEAISDIELALKDAPFLMDARVKLLGLYLAEGRHAEAKDCRTRALHLIRACPAYVSYRCHFETCAGESPRPCESGARSQSPMVAQPYRILTFNWHEPFLATVCKTGHTFDVVATSVLGRARIDSTIAWDERKRPVPANATLLTDASEVQRRLQGGCYDLAICFTIHDLRFLHGLDIPRIFCPLSSPKNDLAAAYDDRLQRESYMAQLRLAARGATVVYTTREMGTEWLGGYDLPGLLVGVAVDEDAYSGYTGEEPVVLRVGNCISERWFLNYPLQKQVLEGIPHRILGVNPGIPDARPAEGWQDLRDNYRSCRLFFHSFDPAFQEAPLPMSAIEAMMTGMPIVTTPHPLSPIVDGVNGFVAGDVASLRAKIKMLLDDRNLAAKLGARARETVRRDYGIAPFLANWSRAIETCLDVPDARAAPCPIQGLREANFLYAPTVSWASAKWQSVVDTYVIAFGAADPVTLVINSHRSGDDCQPKVDEISAQIADYLTGLGFHLDNVPEVILLDPETARLGPPGLSKLFRAVVTPSGESFTGYGQCPRLCVDGREDVNRWRTAAGIQGCRSDEDIAIMAA